MGGKQKLAMSFHEMLEGVGKGHAIAASQPGAMKIDPQVRRDIVARSLGPGRVMHEYNTAELLGPGVVVNRSPKSDRLKTIYTFERNGNFIPGPEGSPSGVTVYNRDIGTNDPTARELIKRTGMRDPVDFSTVEMPVGIGSKVYQMLWDMTRADRKANTPELLTDINQMRRPGNLMSNIITHGDLGNAHMWEGWDYTTHPFAESRFARADRTGAENRALQSILPDPYTREMATKTKSPDMLRYSPLAQVGALGLRELQLAKAHGAADPNYLGAALGEHRLTSLAHPMDADQLKYATQVARREGTMAPWASIDDPFNAKNAFGTGLMGRAGTTEALIHGMHQGRTPEEIMEELLQYRGAENALKGRYAKGGAIHAAIAD
jgi:hypothetical protein